MSDIKENNAGRPAKLDYRREPGTWQKRRNKEPQKDQKPEAPEQEQEKKPGEAEEAAKETASEETELQKLQKEFEEHKQQHLRVLALGHGITSASVPRTRKTPSIITRCPIPMQAILPIADNIERALGQENASAEDMRKGVEMIENQIKACFEKLGLTEMGQVGEPFDPNLHNAVAHIEDESLGENVIAAVYQKGYKLGDRVVRRAMVQVAN